MNTGDKKTKNQDDEFDEFLNRLSKPASESTEEASEKLDPEERSLDDLRNIFSDEQNDAQKNSEPDSDVNLDIHTEPIESPSTSEASQVPPNSESPNNINDDSIDSRLDSLRMELESEPTEQKLTPDNSSVQKVEKDVLQAQVDSEEVEILETDEPTPIQNTEPAPTTHHNDEKRWESAESRLADLQQNFSVEISEKDKHRQEPSIMEIITSDDPTSHTTGKLIYGSLILVILALIGVIIYSLLRPGAQPDPNSAAGRAPVNNAIPASLTILEQNIMLEPYPITAANALPTDRNVWLRDTVVTSLFVLPESKFTIKVEPALVGETIQLLMSDGSTADYEITQIVPMTAEEFLLLANDPKASLAIGVIKDTNSDLMVIQAIPLEPAQ